MSFTVFQNERTQRTQERSLNTRIILKVYNIFSAIKNDLFRFDLVFFIT